MLRLFAVNVAGQELAFSNGPVYYVNVSSSFILNCSLDSRSSTAWYFNNIPLCGPSPREDCSFLVDVTSSGSGNLQFSQLSFEHAGWYTCAVASEELGREERDFLLIVQGNLFAHIHMSLMECLS